MLLFALACTSAPVTEPMPDTLPTPFTAAEIRQGMPTGTTLSFRTRTPDGPEVVSHWEVTDNTEALASFRFQDRDAQGAVVSEQDAAFPWTVLQSHAAFPADRTQVSETRVTVPAGELDVTRYVVTDLAGEQTTYDFAPALPGPPVQMRTVVSGAERLHRVLLTDSRL